MKQLTVLSTILSASLILSACATNDKPVTETITRTVTVDRDVPIRDRPRPVTLRDVDFFVVTEDNYDEFVTRFTEAGNELVFVAMSVSDYEDLSLNLADLKRYIEQQKSVIVYYERAVQ